MEFDNKIYSSKSNKLQKKSTMRDLPKETFWIRSTKKNKGSRGRGLGAVLIGAKIVIELGL